MTTTTFTLKNAESPATPAQLSYLGDLAAKKDHPDTDKIRFSIAMQATTKGQASAWISELIAAPVKAQSPVTAEGIAKAFEVPLATLGVEAHGDYVDSVEVHGSYGAKAKVLDQPALGYYELDDTIYSYNEHKGVYGGKQIKLMKLIKTQVWSTKEQTYVPKGKWVYCGGAYSAAKKLVGAKQLTSTQAGALGKTFGFCIKCGRYLSDPVSIANGIGPVCIKTGVWA